MSYILGAIILALFAYIVFKSLQAHSNKKSGCSNGGCSGCSSASGCPVMKQYQKNEDHRNPKE